jgi:hypothetical protein
MDVTVRKLDVETPGEIAELVAGHAGTVDGGLEVLGARVALGETRIDLVGIDANQALVLVACALVADDEMLLRVLDAYSWALDYPHSVQQLYPGTHVDSDHPPRVVIVAGRVPDGFIRKIRLLRGARLRCFEYRYVNVNGAAAFYLDAIDSRQFLPGATGIRGVTAVDRPAAVRDVIAPSRPPVSRPRAGASDQPPMPERPRVPQRSNDLELMSPEPARPLQAIARVDHPAAGAGSQVDPGSRIESAPRVEPRAESTPRVESMASAEVAAAVESARTVGSTPTVEPPPRAGSTGRVESSSRVEPSPRPNPPRPASREDARVLTAGHGRTPEWGSSVSPVVHPEDRQVLLQGLQLPDNGELAPQWRRALETAGETFDESKIRTVRDHLQREFPHCTIYDFYDLERAAQAFHLQNSQGRVSYLVFVAAEFLDERSDTAIRDFLDRHDLVGTLQRAGAADVMVTGEGVRIERR